MKKCNKRTIYKRQTNKPYINSCNKASLKKLSMAFTNAKYGFAVIWKNEAAFRMEIIIIFIALFILYFLNIDIMLKIILCVLFFILLIVELINSAIEILCDFVKDEYDDVIKVIKDITSSAVGLSIVLNIIIWLYAFYKASSDFFNFH